MPIFLLGYTLRGHSSCLSAFHHLVDEFNGTVGKENVLAYAHGRGMFIVAEGVETASGMQTLVDLGVDLFQGYFLSRPARVPSPVSDEVLRLIKGRDTE